MSSIQQWCERVLNTVEQDGAAVHRVRLLTTEDAQVWETWFAPFGEDFHVQIANHIRSLEQEWPTRTVRLLLVAESAQNEVLSQLPTRATGQLRGGSLDAMSAAKEAAADGLVNTIEKLNRLVHTNLDASRKQHEFSLATMVQQAELINAYRQRDLRDEPSDKEARVAEIGRLLEPYAPRALDLLEFLVKGRG